MSNPKRKLAAIVFTDIVGFTELSAKNEPAALELLNTQRELFKPIVRDHGGDWLKEIGDGLLLTFKTNREAVFCSIAMQEAAKAVKELQLRIGIHQGEVVFQGEDVAGDDVNIEIWYKNSQWVKMVFYKDGSEIEYFLRDFDNNE